MTINQFINLNNIKPADAIIMRKKIFGMVDHYVIYLGFYNNKHKFVANYTKGVKLLTNQELNGFLSLLQPTSIDRFPGSDNERPVAVERAKQRIGENNYSYLHNNCESFKNYVHYGVNYSKQAENFKTGVAVVGAAALVVGILALVFGGEGNGNRRA